MGVGERERELIATYVSCGNDCTYCQSIHGAIAAHHLGGNEALVQAVKLNYAAAGISEKLKALLKIAGKVRESGKSVTPEDVDAVRKQGASDLEIHDRIRLKPSRVEVDGD